MSAQRCRRDATAAARRRGRLGARASAATCARCALMAWIAVHLGRRVARAVLHPITLYFLLFAPAPRRHIARYLARVLGRPAGLARRLSPLHAFASTVLDRVYFVRGRLDVFDIDLGDDGSMRRGARRGPRRASCSARTSAASRRCTRSAQPAAAARRDGDVPRQRAQINAVLQRHRARLRADIIALGRAASMLAMRDWLDAGGLAGLLADRFLAERRGARAGSSNCLSSASRRSSTTGRCGSAMLLRRRVFFMAGLYLGGDRYECASSRWPISASARRRRRPSASSALHAALAGYVARLEALCRE